MKTVTAREAMLMMGVRPETVERITGRPVSDSTRYPVEMIERVLAALRRR